MGRFARFVRIGSSMLSSFLLQARNLVISLVVFRVFADPNEVWGTVSNVVAFVTVISLLGKFGLEFTGVQLVSKYRDDQPRAAVEALKVTSVARLGLTLAVALPMVVAPGWIGGLVGLGDVPQLVQIGSALVVTASVYEFVSFLLSGTDRFGAMANARLVYTAVNIAGIVAAARLAPDDPVAAAAWILWAQVAGGAAAMLYGGAALLGEAWRLGGKPEAEAVADPAPTGAALWRVVIAFSVPMLLLNGAGQLFSYLGRIILPMLTDRSVLGSYAIAESVIAASLFGTYAFRNVARTRLPGLLRTNPSEAREVLLATYRANVIVAAGIGAGAVVVAPDLLVALYGPDAADAAAMLPWFVPYVLLSAHGNFSATALVAADKPRLYAIMMGAMAALGVALNLLLIPPLGAYGAIAGGTLSMIPLVVLAWREVARAYGEELRGAGVVVGSLPALLKILTIAVVSMVPGWLLSAPSLLASGTAGVVLVVVFGGALWATGELQRVRAAM